MAQTPELPEKLTAGREREYLTWFYTNIAHNPHAIIEAEINEYVRAYSAPGAMSAGFEWFRAFPTDIDQNLAGTRSKLPMPVLALGGEKMMDASWCRCYRPLPRTCGAAAYPIAATGWPKKNLITCWTSSTFSCPEFISRAGPVSPAGAAPLARAVGCIILWVRTNSSSCSSMRNVARLWLIVAHGGLLHPQTAGGARDAALLHQRIKGNEQVQIEGAQIAMFDGSQARD